ncbi:MAG: DMT family transporter [Clostridia bacterium]|nr:DMT family transporter [Clostridia bacterium]
MKNARLSSFLPLIIGAVGVSCAGPLVKLLLGMQMPPVTIALWRLSMAAALLLPAFVKKENRKTVNLKAQGGTVSLSACALALHFVCWFCSLGRISTFASTALLCVQPVFTLIGGLVFFKTRPKKAAVLGLIPCAVGVFIIAFAGRGDSGSLSGCLFAVAGALAMAVYLLCNQRLRETMSLTALTFCVYGGCAVLLLFAGCLMGVQLTGFGFVPLLLCAALTLVPTFMGHSMFNFALKFVPASTVSVVGLSEPFLSALWAFLLLSELPTFATLGGGLLIVAGAAYYTVTDAKK